MAARGMSQRRIAKRLTAAGMEVDHSTDIRRMTDPLVAQRVADRLGETGSGVLRSPRRAHELVHRPWPATLVGLAFLLLVRPLAGLAGSAHPLNEWAAIGFFGIRGIGSFYYLAYAYNTAAFEAEAEFLFAVVGFVVLASIVLHCITSTPAMRHLKREWRAEHPSATV
jgi:NhaP-type Na+/H+ or K+/H+ antiporter